MTMAHLSGLAETWPAEVGNDVTNAGARPVARPSVRRVVAPKPRFAPTLSVAIFATRWLDTYATPCHAQGRAFA